MVKSLDGHSDSYYPFFQNLAALFGGPLLLPRRTPPDLVELYKIILMPKTVLIVEDNELNMKLFHNLLEAQRYLLLQTKDGK
jgi:hypothetical protein